ncbi:uncharacterized protein YrzB (UPF0473 family) [Peribacillus deserti]|uniref:Uncharacterized protein YrzB (UPF0473 family) n=1 Tax=Peribacillus deserti TaxID=673318 RepID=A0ABS2QG64_9BACI|nr:DUF1292 domain-containing protein [Peribacillus deserti]MBM7691286.1 uncharacterized protein YrzB (UPF0473 family) [Peribacillus deserti]
MERIEVGETFTIAADTGEDQEVEVLGTINIEGTEYAAVAFVEDIRQETENDIDVFFLKVDQDGDLAAIESDEEFEKVSVAFDEIMEDKS